MIVQSKDVSCATAVKRPVRPILPAYQNTSKPKQHEYSFTLLMLSIMRIYDTYNHMFMFSDRALFQIITVPPDKGKMQTSNRNRSSTGSHLISDSTFSL